MGWRHRGRHGSRLGTCRGRSWRVSGDDADTAEVDDGYHGDVDVISCLQSAAAAGAVVADVRRMIHHQIMCQPSVGASAQRVLS